MHKKNIHSRYVHQESYKLNMRTLFLFICKYCARNFNLYLFAAASTNYFSSNFQKNRKTSLAKFPDAETC